MSGSRGPRHQLRLPWPDALAGASDNEIAKRLGVTRMTIWHRRQRGITIYQADALAVEFGAHPWQWWPYGFDLPQDEPELDQMEAA